MGENVKVVIAKADAAASAASAARAAYDAKCVRNLLAEVVAELHTIASAIDSLKGGIVVLNDRITAMESATEVADQIASLQDQVSTLARAVKKSGKKKIGQEEA